MFEGVALPTRFGLLIGGMLFALLLVGAWIERVVRSRTRSGTRSLEYQALGPEIENWEDEGGST